VSGFSRIHKISDNTWNWERTWPYLQSFFRKAYVDKQLSDRPLSLPGLTATCTKLLQNIAEVYANKVVVCIDELDKITSIDQLTELLKGVKGILGQENTHFILTISEDAMSKFTERLSSDRNLIESSFEEIVYLDRVDRQTGMHIVRQSLTAMDVVWGEEFERACLLFWIFGAGVPREIKRFVFSCFSSGIDVYDGQSFSVWKLIYLDMLQSMIKGTSQAKTDDAEAQYNFLLCIESLIKLVGGQALHPNFVALLL
jgi:hypothetical protein